MYEVLTMQYEIDMTITLVSYHFQRVCLSYSYAPALATLTYIPDCDIRSDFDTNKYPHIFKKRRMRLMSQRKL